MATVLLTGFEPFAGAVVNPSWEAARDVAATWSGHDDVVAVALPVEFGAATRRLHHALDEHRPAVAIALGVAEGRTDVTPERVAINITDARIPDNAGAQPIDEPCIAGAPDGLLTTLPVKAMLHAMRASAIPSSLSHTAGTYVCNHVFFHLQEALRESGVRSGFIHVPATPQMWGHTSAPTLDQEIITSAVRICVETALAVEHDIHLAGGSLH